MSWSTVDYDVFCDKIDRQLLDWFRDVRDRRTMLNLAVDIMLIDGFPMHYPLHHYLVPALLLTAVRKKQSYEEELLVMDILEARQRSKNILGGFCGFYGCCGAAVGVGIFWCILTSCTPVTSVAWSYGNRSTGIALQKLAEVGGPRCCKRCLFLALGSALPQIEEVLGVTLEHPENLCCNFYRRNDECLKEKCPFYWEKQI